jgi:16S rRNA G966 N2-methylase RsmD
MINPGGMVVVEHSPHEKIGQEYTDKIIQQKGTRQTILTFLKA